MAAIAERLTPRASQAVFRVLLDSLARPGQVLALPEPGPGPGIVPLALAVVGSPVAVLGDPAWQQAVCQATGARPAAAGEASLVALCEAADAAAVIPRLRRGSALAPEQGAKVGLACRRLSAGGPGEVTLELSGPGVPGRVRLGVDGAGRAVFDALREANALFPAGLDVWLVDSCGQVAGLPRSARQVVV